MSSPRGKGRGRGRGRGKAKKVEIENGDIPELDEPPPPVVTTPIRQSVRLTSLTSSTQDDSDDDDDDVKELPQDENSRATEESAAADESMDSTVAGENGMETEEQPSVEKSDNEDSNSEKADGAVEDAEMVSEDELFSENKEPLDTEAVSDEELREESQGLPETEAVSDDELPEEKRRKAKVAEAEAVSEDELPDEVDKKDKTDESPPKTEENGLAKVDGKRKLPEGEYDPNSPTSEHSGDGGPAAKKQAVGDGVAAAPAKKAMPELEKYWKAVKDDPSDFTGWTYLLQYVDQENDIEMAREAYDAFLAHYPYCYGYWRKYADFEKRKGHIEECEQVFERGLKAIPLSVDLWLHYLNYCKAAHPDDHDFVRSQFERAISACGLEFRSDRLWESYIKWEKEKKNSTEVTALYDRLLAIPTQGYTTHFDAFQEIVNQNPPQTILPVDDFLDLRREVLQELKQNKSVVSAVSGEEAPPGDDASPNEEEDSGASVTTRMEEETSALREKILSSRRKVHKATVAAVAARWNYEEGIKRPYFHVKPLERCQLKNWKEYLEFEIELGDHKRIVTLFERCLIACALYEEFWVRFIRYLETIPGDQTEKIRDVYERACTIHHKKKPNLHLQWSVFEETAGCHDKAAIILENMEKTTPNLLQVAYRRINLERRRGKFEEAAKLYEDYIALNKSKQTIFTNMTVKYARFTWKFLNDIDKAIEILEKALEKDKDNTRLYLQLIDMGLQKSPVDEQRILGILNQFLEKEGDIEQKVMFAQRKIEFLEDFGSNIESVQTAQEEFQKYIKQVKEKKKKVEVEPTAPVAASPASKKTKTETATASATPAMPSGPTAPNAPPPNAAPPTGGYPPSGYPPNYYGQYPPPTGDQSSYPNNYPPSGYNNYSNWNYQQGNYGNYQQPGWPGYYPNY